MYSVNFIEHAEEIWFAVMLVLVAIFSGWNYYNVLSGHSVSLRYGLPLFSGLPPQAQQAVKYFETHPPKEGYSEVIDGILVVNMTVMQYKYIPNVIIANTSEPVVIILNSVNISAGFYLRLPNGVINVNSVPGVPDYIYFVTPNSPGNYTWREPEYVGYSSSYMTGTLEVV